jgi:hypothetical protein
MTKQQTKPVTVASAQATLAALEQSASNIASAPSNLRLSASAALTPRTRSTMLKLTKRTATMHAASHG